MFLLRQIAHNIFVRPICRTNFFWSGPTFGGSRSRSHNIKCRKTHIAHTVHTTTTHFMSHNHDVPSRTTKFLSVWTHLKGDQRTSSQKMELPVVNVPDCVVCSVIFYLTTKNITTCDIYREVCATFREGIIREQKVGKWWCDFCDWQRDVHDLPRSGQPQDFITEDVILSNNKRLTLCQLECLMKEIKRCSICYPEAPSTQLWLKNWSCQKFPLIGSRESWQKTFAMHGWWQQLISLHGTRNRRNPFSTGSWWGWNVGAHVHTSHKTSEHDVETKLTNHTQASSSNKWSQQARWCSPLFGILLASYTKNT